MSEAPFVRDFAFETLIRERCEKFFTTVRTVIVGDDDLLWGFLVALFAQSSILLESRPGEGKSLFMRAAAAALSLDAKWHQFKGDDLPGELIGTVYRENGEIKILRGPLFTNIFMGDEINRAPSKAKSPLLNAMQEKFVKIPGSEVVEHLPDPFFFVGTQNPIEEASDTYRLGRAELNRFGMKIKIPVHSVDDLKKIIVRNPEKNLARIEPVLSREEILSIIKYVQDLSGSALACGGAMRDVNEDPLVGYIARLGAATNFTADGKATPKGASGRPMMSLWLLMNAYRVVRGKRNLSAHDVQQMLVKAWAHRMNTEDDDEAEMILRSTLKRISPIPKG
jgi:MoxR-like ATPase